MNDKRCVIFLFVLVAAGLTPGCRKDVSQTPPKVAATNSMLECAAKDLLGETTPVLRLAEPGMCPGHFDIRPSQIDQLRRCLVLLRLDFQKSLDSKLSGAQEEGLCIVEVQVPGGLCEPASYLSACRQTADALVTAGLLEPSAAEKRLAEIDDRISRESAECLQRMAHLKGMPVLASAHQEAFCRWLGLNVVATFSGADSAGVGQIESAIRQGEQAGVKAVIANRPEGRRTADALGERLGAKVVVFGNFPALNEGQKSFDDLVVSNTEALREAVTP